jgi:hypothetical protein
MVRAETGAVMTHRFPSNDGLVTHAAAAFAIFVLHACAYDTSDGAVKANTEPQVERGSTLLGLHSPRLDRLDEISTLFGGRGGYLVQEVYSTDGDWLDGLAARLRDARRRGMIPVIRLDYARPDGSAWADATLERPNPAPGATIPPPGRVGWCLKRAPQPWEPMGGPAEHVADETHLGCWMAYVSRAVRTLDSVHTWIVGNEMNIRFEARAFSDEIIPPLHYADVYRRTRALVRSIPGHENDQVVVGGVSPGATHPHAPQLTRSGRDYLVELLYWLHPNEVDAVALHAYGGWSDQNPLQTFRTGIDGGMGYQNQARLLDELGYSAVPAFVSEWSALTKDAAHSSFTERFLRESARDVHEWNQGPNNHPIHALVWFLHDGGELFPEESIVRFPGVQRAFTEAAQLYPSTDPSRRGTCVAPPGGRTRRFVETGRTVSGLFLQRWERAGDASLSAFGFPISDAGCIEDTRTGRILFSQWFQRHRFEYHPENAGRALELQVMLGSGGAMLAREQAGVNPDDWTPQARPSGRRCELIGPGPNMGKWVCDDFLNRFRRDGVSLLGYPISAEMPFRTVDGTDITVQWFERARLERHAWGVEGGLLGCEQTRSNVLGCPAR